MSSEFDPYVIAVIPQGKFLWWKSLGIVDFRGKGKRLGKAIRHLKHKENTIDGAYAAVIEHMSERWIP